MKKNMNWSYTPYRPLFEDVGEIYICRIAPYEGSIVFDFLDIGAKSYNVYFRVRGEEKFELAGTALPNGKRDITYTVTGLSAETEYEFFVEADGKKSRVRIARCGRFDCEAIINYLHPDDEAYAFSGRYLCSPSILRHPDGYLLSSMDVFAANHPQNLTLIYRSDDDGRTWRYACELFPCFWGKMFLHNGEIYMFGCSTEYGDMLIGKSTDGGYTFCEPTVLYRGSNGKNGNAGMHRAPQLVVTHSGRIWNSVEWGTWAKNYHAVMCVSAPVDSDLLDAASWEFTEPVKYRHWEGLPHGDTPGNIEGCPVVGRDGKLYSMMRYHMMNLNPKYGLAMLYRINTEAPAAPMEFFKAVKFPANNSKFEVVWDEDSGYYWALGSRILSSDGPYNRNLMSLFKSPDLENWEVAKDVIDYRHSDPKLFGFQYADMIIDGDDILFQCRTAVNGARTFHDTNYATLHRVKDFRKL